MNTRIHICERFIWFVAALSTLVILVGCTWNRSELSATVRWYNEHRGTLELMVADARKGVSDYAISNRYPEVCAKQFQRSRAPLVLEFTPVAFYYVLVFAEEETALRKSSAMQDEGGVKKRLGGGWYVVQRGWM